MSNVDEEGDEQSFLKRNWVLVAVTSVIFLAVCLAVWKMSSGVTSAPPKQEHIAMVSLPPPLVRPPPPPPPPPPEQKVVEQKERMEEPTPDKPEPPDAPDEPPTMGSGIKGDPDGFGLSGSGSGGRVGFGGKGKGGAKAYSRYASQIQGRIAEALRQDKKTRTSSFDLRLKLWIDSGGVITRAEPAGGDANATAAATVLGLRFQERPPEGMPMPLIARISARRPN